MRYQRDGLEGLEEPKKNNHYSKELKHAVVFAYLNGEGTYEELTDKYGLRNNAQAKAWVDQYNGDKPLTASPSRKQVLTVRRKTTFEERIEVVEYVVKHKHSYTEAAEHFQVSYQQARSWVLKTKNGGYEALVDNHGDIIKTVTADNGSEFADLSRVLCGVDDVYYAHPYRSSERGTNEAHNRML